MKGGEIMTDIGTTIASSLNNGLLAFVSFIPKLVAGAIVLLIGVIVASLLKQLLISIFKALSIEKFLKKYGVPELKEEFSWTNILAELVRWFVIVLFLVPTAEVWGLSKVTAVLNQVLMYLPSVFVAAIIAMVGFVFARLTHDVVLVSIKNVDPKTSSAIASVARWAINIFVILAVLTQLGVAADLIRILFTGLVAMMALAGGIAFGLGGQGGAKELIDGLKKKFK
jgi:hypothetical protein